MNISFHVGAADLFGLGQHRQACYESGGSQTPLLGRVFPASPGAVHFDLARGEGGASNTLPWLMGVTAGQADFGIWMNNPAMGTVDFDSGQPNNRTMRWSFAAVRQLDYLVTTTPPPPATTAVEEEEQHEEDEHQGAIQLLERFTSWVGRSPGLPEWALGHWHSKNRYSSQKGKPRTTTVYYSAIHTN